MEMCLLPHFISAPVLNETFSSQLYCDLSVSVELHLDNCKSSKSSLLSPSLSFSPFLRFLIGHKAPDVPRHITVTSIFLNLVSTWQPTLLFH